MKKCVTVQVRVDPNTDHLIRLLAQRENENRSEFLRRLVRDQGRALGLWPPADPQPHRGKSEQAAPPLTA